MKDKNVIFRCDDYEMSMIKTLPYLLEEYVPGVSFNRTRAINYAVAYMFREVTKEVFGENKKFKNEFDDLEGFRKYLLDNAEKM